MPMYLIYSVGVLEVLNSNKCCSSALMISYALLSARWYHDQGFLLLLEIWQTSGYNCLCNFCCKSLSRLLDSSVVYIHCQELMEVIGEKWQQLMALIHSNPCWRWDALVLLSSMKVRTALILVTVGLVVLMFSYFTCSRAIQIDIFGKKLLWCEKGTEGTSTFCENKGCYTSSWVGGWVLAWS